MPTITSIAPPSLRTVASHPFEGLHALQLTFNRFTQMLLTEMGRHTHDVQRARVTSEDRRRFQHSLMAVRRILIASCECEWAPNEAIPLLEKFGGLLTSDDCFHPRFSMHVHTETFREAVFIGCGLSHSQDGADWIDLSYFLRERKGRLDLLK